MGAGAQLDHDRLLAVAAEAFGRDGSGASLRRPRDAISTVPDAGVTAGEVRAGVEATDLMTGLGGVTLIAGEEQQREVASRAIDPTLLEVTVSNGQ
jgi:hypothetical protein